MGGATALVEIAPTKAVRPKVTFTKLYGTCRVLSLLYSSSNFPSCLRLRNKIPTTYEVRDSIREIDNNDKSWVIREKLLLTLQESTPVSGSGCFWKNDDDACFLLSENLPDPLSATRPLSQQSIIQRRKYPASPSKMSHLIKSWS